MYYVYESVRAIPTYRVYRLHGIIISMINNCMDSYVKCLHDLDSSVQRSRNSHKSVYVQE